jgi:hypothetical protein
MDKHESHAENTKAAYDVMQQLGVTLYDLELWGIMAGRDDVLGGPEQAFDALIEDGFSLGESRYIEHYYQATADYVYDALEERDLIKDEDDGTSGQDRDNYTDDQDRESYTVDEAWEDLRAVERGDKPSGSVIVPITGPNSLTNPGERS